MERPDVSVVVPVFNQRAHLRAAVTSILDERAPRCEVIVVDDCSTDGSAGTVSDLPVRILRLAENVGGAGATNAGIRAAEGEYVTFLDSDDLLSPGGLAWRLEWAREHPEVDVFGGRPAGIIDEEGRPLPEFQHVLHPGYTPPSTLTWDFFQRGGFYPVAQWLYFFRREVFAEVGLFDEEFRDAYDCDFLFRVLQHHAIPIVFEPVVLRRLHSANGSVSRGSGAWQLTPATIAACERIFARYGIKATGWNLWEQGFAD